MKTQFKRGIKLFSFMLTMVAVFGCHKDDHSVTPTPANLGDGAATLVDASAQETYPTTHAYAFGLGSNPGGATTTNFVLEFANGSSDGIYYSANTTTIISFDINSGSSGKIQAGTYALDYSNLYKPFTFSTAYAHFHLEHQPDGSLTGGDQYETPVSGSLILSYQGETAHLVYQLTFADGETLAGEYTGKVKPYSV